MIRPLGSAVSQFVMSTDPAMFARWLEKNINAEVTKHSEGNMVTYYLTVGNSQFTLVESKVLHNQAGVLAIELLSADLCDFRERYGKDRVKLVEPEGVEAETYRIWNDNGIRKIIGYLRVCPAHRPS